MNHFTSCTRFITEVSLCLFSFLSEYISAARLISNVDTLHKKPPLCLAHSHPTLSPSFFPQTGMWACRHAATFLPETPFSGETDIMSGIYQKKCL